MFLPHGLLYFQQSFAVSNTITRFVVWRTHHQIQQQHPTDWLISYQIYQVLYQIRTLSSVSTSELLRHTKYLIRQHGQSIFENCCYPSFSNGQQWQLNRTEGGFQLKLCSGTMEVVWLNYKMLSIRKLKEKSASQKLIMCIYTYCRRVIFGIPLLEPIIGYK